jgi:predicted AlkP superfamily phosphohydrolase/phosphomutase
LEIEKSSFHERFRTQKSVPRLLTMTSRRLLVIGLDGFDLPLAEKFQAEGMLPNFTRFQKQAASFKLDHGRDKYSGLAWEHLSAGVSPTDGGRWSAVSFDKSTYSVRQNHSEAHPFVADLSARTVVFDFPYFDLSHAPGTRGITAWGAHDPGVAPASRPDTLYQEIKARFGPYPAPEWIYGFCWPSTDKARAAGESLVQAVELRSRITQWLFAERLPDWDLGVVVISESHSAIEPLWHGVDENHPLRHIDSGPVAAAALRNVYQAMDTMIGDLRETFKDATMLLVAMHGMGANESDVPAMALLPELLYRYAFGKNHMRPVSFSNFLPDGTPLLSPDDSWHATLWKAVPKHRSLTKMPERVGNLLERIGFRLNRPDGSTEITWMPATRYSHFWPRMKAFALPSFYDGRVRLNVIGREAKGLIPPNKYQETCQQITEVIAGCRNLQTGKKVVHEIYAPKRNPLDVGPAEADLYVIWEGAPLGFTNPRLGSIGPLPYLRTGGHTGQYGFLFIAGEDVPSGDYGVASSFDVVPTVIELLGETKKPGISGKSLVPSLASGSLADRRAHSY